MNREKIEHAAILAVENAFLSLERVTSRLDTQDKIPCTDGWIEVRNSAAQDKANIIGKIDVQIKGTTSKPSSDSHYSKSVDIADLKHYRNVCFGALYFVVCMKSDYTPRGIYYAQLLPFDIDQILKRAASGQRTIKIKFKPLPKDSGVLDRLCSEFVEDKKRQSGDIAIGFKTIDEWRSQGLGVQNNLVLSKSISDPAELASLDVWGNGGYWYAQTSEGILHAIERIEAPDAVEVGTATQFEAGDFRTTITLIQGDSRDGRYFKFGSFEIRMGQEPKLRYTPKGSIQELYRDARLAQGLCETGTLKMGSLTLSGITFSKLTLDGIKGQVRLLEKHCQLIACLKIKSPLVLEELTENDIRQLGKLGAAFVDGAHQIIPNTEERLVNLNVDLSIGRIKVIAKADQEGKYEFWNPLANGTVCLLVKDYLDSPENYKPLPSSFILTKDDFRQTINLDVDAFSQSLGEIPICEGNAEGANSKLLDMLSAFDEGACCKNELIECCQILAEKILSLNPNNQNYQLNLLQSIVRKRELTAEERANLRRIIVMPSDKRVLAGAYIVAGELELAEAAIAQFDNADLEEFRSWPIYNLLVQT